MKNYLFLAGILVGSLNLYAQVWDFTVPKKLGGSINTEAEEGMPVFSKDSSILYFVRMYDATNIGGLYDQDIWFSKRDENGVYSTCERVKDLNNKYNNALFGVSGDGNKLYLSNAYEGKKDMVKGCAVSIKKGGIWQAPEHVEVPTLDINGDFYGFHVNEAGNVMLISYEGPGTIGEEDLYVSTKTSDKWSVPLHMGNVVNTTGFEITPFLSKNSDTLYFSSNGHGGLGDADVFYSVRQGSSWNSWSKPVNLGNKINSPKFDASFTSSANNVYWSSNRDSEKSDIYFATAISAPPLEASVKVTNVTVYKGSDGQIDLVPEGGALPYAFLWSNGSKDEDLQGLVKGKYSVVVTDAIGQIAKISVYIDEPIEAPPVIAQRVEKVEQKTAPVEHEIYFDLNSSYLNKKNKQSLNNFIANMKGNSTVQFVVVSHCDSRESEHYNFWLSKRRMKRTIEYLSEHGIDSSKLTGHYKGESEPKISCSECTEEQHEINRRTTISAVYSTL